MAIPGHDSVLGSLRCLSALPVCSPRTATCGMGADSCCTDSPGAGGSTHARRYQTALHQKVSSAVTGILHMCGVVDGSEGSPAHMRTGGARGQPRSTALARCAPHPTPATAALSLGPLPPAAQSRKRSAALAALDDPPPGSVVGCQPSSSTHGAPIMSDGCTTPTAPATQTEGCLGTDSGPHAGQQGLQFDDGPEDAGTGAVSGGIHEPLAASSFAFGRPSQHPRQDLTAAPEGCGQARKQQRQQQRSQMEPLTLAPHLAVGPPGATQAPVCSLAGARASLDGSMSVKATMTVPGGQVKHGRDQSGQRIEAQQATGPDLAQVQQQGQVQQQSRGQGRSMRHDLLPPGSQAEAAAPVGPSLSTPAQQTQIHVCRLPGPALTLQDIITRRSLFLGPPLDMPKALHGCRGGQRPAELGPGQLRPDPLQGITSLASPQLLELLARTASATGELQQEHMAMLPETKAVLQRWPLDLLDERFGQRSSATASGETEQLLRYVGTAMPRRSAAMIVDLPCTRGLPVPLPLEGLGASLSADTCQCRRELWQFYQEGLRDQVETTLAGGSVPSRSTGVDSCDGGDVIDRVCDCTCHAAEPGPKQTDVSGGNDVSDETDVYITDDGLVCLASLSYPCQRAGGWRLPFLVKQRQVSSAQGTAPDKRFVPGLNNVPACERCNRPTHPLTRAARHVLIFTEPLLNEEDIQQNSWTRICAFGLAARCKQSLPAASSGRAAEDGTIAGMRHAPDSVDLEDCPHCQQDDWQLGDMSLLVQSHCQIGSVMPGQAADAVAPLQVLAVAAPQCHAAATGLEGALAVDVAEVLRRHPEAACRAELFVGGMTTLVLGVDPGSCSLVAESRLDHVSLLRLATEVQAGDAAKSQRRWRLVKNLLTELQRLPPGPYMLSTASHSGFLELKGAVSRSR